MGKDPAFLFYPGDYLRDTQTMSEATQVAYDRIICEHMRNICISQQQLKFFTKRLNEDEIAELMHVLTKVDGGYQVSWVAESIVRRRNYSASRSENRKGKTKTTPKKTSKSYVKHMENEIEIEDVSKNKSVELVFPFDSDEFMSEWRLWKAYRKEQGAKPYQTIGEQAALRKLSKLARNDTEAIAIIRQSIENGWKGFFEVEQKRKNNGKRVDLADIISGL